MDGNIQEGGFVSPTALLQAAAIPRGSRVADFGAGTGALALAAARIVGEEGHVYAIDVQRDLLQKLASHAQAEHLDWVEIVWGDVDEPGGSKIADNSVDFVLLVNTLFQLEEPEDAMREIVRVLRPGGKLILVDWQDSFGGMGPVRESVVSEVKAKAFADAAGLTFERSLDAGSHHHGAVFTSPR